MAAQTLKQKVTDKQLEQLVELWQHRLGLTHWQISVDADYGREDEQLAEINMAYYDGHIEVAAWLLGQEEPPCDGVFVRRYEEDPQRTLEVTIVHELLHACVSDAKCQVCGYAEKHFSSKQEAEDIMTVFDTQEELFVDCLANGLVDTFRREVGYK